MTDANQISRQYIAQATTHRVGSPIQLMPARRVNGWSVFVNASALGFFVVLGLVAWVGLGR